MEMKNFVIISGCSGGGKSTLLAELSLRGHTVVEEPGRRIVARETASGGTALPWINLQAFAQSAIDMACNDMETVKAVQSWVFFDRGLIDAWAALSRASGMPINAASPWIDRFFPTVFFTPPWPGIYQRDTERRHDLDASLQEYEHLIKTYTELGFRIEKLPKIPIVARADFIQTRLSI